MATSWTPTARKPGKKATDEQKRQYKEQQRQKNINAVGLARVKLLAEKMDRDLWLRGRRPRLCPTQRLISQLRLE